MGFYDIDYNVVTWQNLPLRLRQVVQWAWLKVLVMPVKICYASFMIFRGARLYELAHNSQVCFIQAALNDLFDNTDRRITVTEPDYNDPLYVYRVDEDKPVWLGLDSEAGSSSFDCPRYLYTDAETVSIVNVFIVNVPAGLVYDEAQMKALIGKYRLVGTKYVVVVF